GDFGEFMLEQDVRDLVRDVARYAAGGAQRVGDDVRPAVDLEGNCGERECLDAFEFFEPGDVDQAPCAHDLELQVGGECSDVERVGWAQAEFGPELGGPSFCGGFESSWKCHRSAASTRRTSSVRMSVRRPASRCGTPGRITDAARRWHAMTGPAGGMSL